MYFQNLNHKKHQTKYNLYDNKYNVTFKGISSYF